MVATVICMVTTICMVGFLAAQKTIQMTVDSTWFLDESENKKNCGLTYVVLWDTGPFQGFGGGKSWCNWEVNGLSSGVSESAHACKGRAAELFCTLSGHHDQRARAIVQRRGVASRHRPIFFENGAQRRKFGLVKFGVLFVLSDDFIGLKDKDVEKFYII